VNAEREAAKKVQSELEAELRVEAAKNRALSKLVEAAQKVVEVHSDAGGEASDDDGQSAA
jgi:hypothetical protein